MKQHRPRDGLLNGQTIEESPHRLDHIGEVAVVLRDLVDLLLGAGQAPNGGVPLFSNLLSDALRANVVDGRVLGRFSVLRGGGIGGLGVNVHEVAELPPRLLVLAPANLRQVIGHHADRLGDDALVDVAGGHLVEPVAAAAAAVFWGLIRGSLRA